MSVFMTIKLSGVELTQQRHPNLCKWAQEHPETLHRQLEGLMKATGASNLQSTAEMFEHDLEHERLCGS